MSMRLLFLHTLQKLVTFVLLALYGFHCRSSSRIAVHNWQKPIFPPDETNPLAKQLYEHLSKATWARTLVTGKIPDPLSSSPEVNSGIISVHLKKRWWIVSDATVGDSETSSSALQTPIKVGPSSSSGYAVTTSSPSTSKRTTEPPSPSSQDSSIGIASRKPQRDQTIAIGDEEDEDKYKKRSVMQLFIALGLV